MNKNRIELKRSGDSQPTGLPGGRAKPGNQPRTRRRNLIALGINPGKVHMATRSRKGLPALEKDPEKAGHLRSAPILADEPELTRPARARPSPSGLRCAASMAARRRRGHSLLRAALNNRWLEEQGVPDMNAPAAQAAFKSGEAILHGRSEAQSKQSGSFFTTGRKPASDWNRPVRSRTQGGVGPVAG